MEKFVRSKSPVTGGFTVVSAGYEIDWGGGKSPQSYFTSPLSKISKLK